MIKIGLVSDTHGYWDEKLDDFFEGVDELWHAGDIGSIELLDNLSKKWKVRAVYGNIDGGATRLAVKPLLFFTVEQVSILMTHIGGYPNKYERQFLSQIQQLKPMVVVAGHSHILKVIFDKQNNLLFMNPGAAGIAGFHAVRTALRLVINGDRVTDVEVAEWERKSNR